MSDIVISAENLGKKYLIGHQSEKSGFVTLRDTLVQGARTAWKKTKDLATGKPIILGDEVEEVWALKDVSFEVKRGEALGIIGRNGAGKSTLLKILSRITEPTTGRVTIKGRVSSLLEVGTGFHPELTGRENIFLNGTILGMTRAEIKRKFDEIVAFSEVEKFLDTPVKRYSSGMYVRLAFAVAAHLEPEILIVDEVLAVGDAQFQKKCLGKMSDVAGEGRTVLFVSHNMGAVQQLTGNCVLLSNGALVDYGPTDRVVAEYQSVAMKTTVDLDAWPRTNAQVDGRIRFRRAQLHGLVSPMVRAGEDFPLLLTVVSNMDCEHFGFSLTVFKLDGTPVGSLFSHPTATIRKGEEASFLMPLSGMCLAPGKYTIGIAVGVGDPLIGYTNFDRVMDILPFEVVPRPGQNGTLSFWTTSWGSVEFPKPAIHKLVQ